MKKLHLGIIPDGNRRYCYKHNMMFNNIIDYWYKNMFLKNINEIIDSNFEILKEFNQVQELSIYISSIDNINRNDKTVELGYELIRKLYFVYCNNDKFFSKRQCEIIKNLNYNFKINIVGEYQLIPDDIKQILNSIDKMFNSKAENILIINYF